MATMKQKPKKTPHPNDDYKNMKDPATGKKGTIGGEGKTPPSGKGDKVPKSAILPKRTYVGGSSAKNGKTMKKAKNGTSLGMKSVKAGFDKNPGVTRADIITAAKGKAKNGTSMKKCKYGCK
jgi:hypothetical protein